MKYILLITISFLLSLTGRCQNATDTMIQKGYIIFLGVDGWFFQPLGQCNKPFYESLNNESFSIRYGTDGYNDALRDFEDRYLTRLKHTDTVFYKIRNDTTHYVGSIQYELVEMTYMVRLDNHYKIKKLSSCHFSISEIHQENKKYDLFCCFFEAMIYNIKRLEE